jgi:hypothetical protein
LALAFASALSAAAADKAETSGDEPSNHGEDETDCSSLDAFRASCEDADLPESSPRARLQSRPACPRRTAPPPKVHLNSVEALHAVHSRTNAELLGSMV